MPAEIFVGVKLTSPTAEELKVSREWFDQYTGPKYVEYHPATKKFRSGVGYNAVSAAGARGVFSMTESEEEEHAVYALWRLVEGHRII